MAGLPIIIVCSICGQRETGSQFIVPALSQGAASSTARDTKNISMTSSTCTIPIGKSCYESSQGTSLHVWMYACDSAWLARRRELTCSSLKVQTYMLIYSI